jgi:hypothetical protein
VKLDIKIDGISGRELTGLLPKLKTDLDGSTLTDGCFTAQLEATMEKPRSDPLDWDMAEGFGAEIEGKDIQFRGSPNGPILLGVGEITAQGIRVRPDSLVTIKGIEVTNPIARIVRDEVGYHVLGCVVKWPPAAQASAAGQDAEPPVAVPSVRSPSPSGSGEIRIARLLVSGVDCVMEDRTCDPPLIVPLTNLDLTVHDLSSRMADADRPFRFHLMIGAGKVPLPSGTKTEQRELFSQIEASGMLSLYPWPKGWIKSSISSLELPAFGGEARRFSVGLTGGRLDSSADLRFGGDGSIQTQTKWSVTDLSLADGPEGPIKHWLNSGATLDRIIDALEDADGSITIPLDVPIRDGQISRGDINAAAVGAIGNVVVVALASAPLKAVNALGTMMGAGDDKHPDKNHPIVLEIPAGQTELTADDLAELTQLARRLKKEPTLEMTLHHQLSAGDVARADELANPSAEDCRDLAYQLRLKKKDLTAARASVAAEVSGRLAWGRGAEVDAAVSRLRDIERALATTEDALDSVYGMLAPGADRQAARRTRAACVEIGRARCATVRQTLESLGVPDIERVKFSVVTALPVDGISNGRVVLMLSYKKKL